MSSVILQNEQRLWQLLRIEYRKDTDIVANQLIRMNSLIYRWAEALAIKIV